MALSASIFRVELQVADMDRQYYETHVLTVARHPSETDERMMVRLLAFGLHAHPDLGFTRGISTDDEPDLWRRNASGEIEAWIELGQPDEKRLRRACGRALEVYVYTYNDRAARAWWGHMEARAERFSNLRVRHLAGNPGRGLAQLVRKGMQLSCTVQEGEAWLGDDRDGVAVTVEDWKRAC